MVEGNVSLPNWFAFIRSGAFLEVVISDNAQVKPVDPTKLPLISLSPSELVFEK